MIEVCEKVKKLEEISAVVVCHKLDSKMDTQFKNTIHYYAEFFRPFKDRNFVIVLTNVQTDERTIKKRKRDGFDLEKICEQIIKAVREIANLNYDPMVLCVDANPMYDDEDYEYRASFKLRGQLLDFVGRLTPIKTETLLFKKTPAMMHEDEIAINKIKGSLKVIYRH